MGDHKPEPTGDLIKVPLSQLEKLGRGLVTSERTELDDLLDEAVNEDPNLD